MQVSRERTPSLDVKLQCTTAPPPPPPRNWSCEAEGTPLDTCSVSLVMLWRASTSPADFSISSCGPRGGCCRVIDRPIAGEVTEGLLFSKVWLNILPVERLERAKDGKEAGVSGGLWKSSACVRSGEMRVMVTCGDWECDQNKGVHVGMLLVAWGWSSDSVARTALGLFMWTWRETELIIWLEVVWRETVKWRLRACVCLCSQTCCWNACFPCFAFCMAWECTALCRMCECLYVCLRVCVCLSLSLLISAWRCRYLGVAASPSLNAAAEGLRDRCKEKVWKFGETNSQRELLQRQKGVVKRIFSN